MNSKRKQEVRLKLLIRQKFLCYYCEKPLAIIDATLDHKIPKADGGSNRMNNLVVCCSWCNLRKGRVTFKTFVKKMIWPHW